MRQAGRTEANHNQRVTKMIKTTRREFLKYGAVGATLASPAFRDRASAEPLKIGQVNASPAAEIGWANSMRWASTPSRRSSATRLRSPSSTASSCRRMPNGVPRTCHGRQQADLRHQLLAGHADAKVAPRFPRPFSSIAPASCICQSRTFEAKYYEGAYVAGVRQGTCRRRQDRLRRRLPIPDIVGPPTPSCSAPRASIRRPPARRLPQLLV